MTDIAAFLTARLDEAEADAASATPGPWHVDPMKSNVVRSSEVLDRVGTAGTRTDLPVFTDQTSNRYRGQWEADAAHIARHDPARVLADIAAKRAIIEDYRIVVANNAIDEAVQPGRVRSAARDLIIKTLRMVLVRLASAHDAHPDYDESWRT